ncbi:MAG: HAD family hydrolase, partial [Acidimicrobiales bacterium]
DSLVDAVCISGDIGIEKPDPRIYRAAAELTNTPLDGWMVGDSPVNDVVGAARLGLRTAWIRRGRAWTEAEATPTVIVDRLDQLAAAIDDVEGGRSD